jgi:hypothetical protein
MCNEVKGIIITDALLLFLLLIKYNVFYFQVLSIQLEARDLIIISLKINMI